jgi:ADP-ribosylglycohydrolase
MADHPNGDLTATPLFDRIDAAMLGGAIGDAMGGPVEGWPYPRIQETYGVVDRFLPYETEPDYHNHFNRAPGSVTDDTRLKHLLARTLSRVEAPPTRGDWVRTLVEAYHQADDRLTRGFLEEYALRGVDGRDALAWGGRPTNGFLMANAPVGLIRPCDPHAAYRLSLRLDFISGGYARVSAAMGAAAVAAALCPGAGPDDVVETTLDVARAARREGPLTRGWQWHDHVFGLNERWVARAVAIAREHRDVFAVRPAYYDALTLGPLGSEAAQTLAVALGMLVAAEGDVRRTVIGCVNYGRDNDSYAALGGALAGAMRGTASIPPDWRETVEAANPEPDRAALSLGLTRVAYARFRSMAHVVSKVGDLLK